MSNPDEIIKYFPTMLATVARAANADVALRLAGQWGGTKRYIPATPKASHAISKIVGLEAAKELASIWGGQHCDIPCLPQTSIKKLKIISHQGSTREVAKDCGCSERWVRAVRAEVFGKASTRTPSLNQNKYTATPSRNMDINGGLTGATRVNLA